MEETADQNEHDDTTVEVKLKQHGPQDAFKVEQEP